MSRKIGLFLLSAGTLVYELLLTRLFSVAQFYHFAFVAVSLALLGFGASGALLSLFPRWVTQNTQKVSLLAVGCAVSIAGSYLAINTLPFDSYAIAWDRRQFLYLVLYLLSLAVPFGFSGLAVGILLAAEPARVHRTYAYNLAGSAAGCLLLLPALPLLGGERAVLLASWLALGAAAVMQINPTALPSSQDQFRSGLPSAQTVPTLAVLALCTWWLASPPGVFSLHISPYKGLYQALLDPEAQLASSRWNVFSRVDVVKSPSIRSLPGLSYTYREDFPSQVGVAVDAGAMMPITAFEAASTETTSGGGDPAWAHALPEAFVYQIRPGARTLVLQPGGGLAAATALANGAGHITVVENNPLLVRAVRDDYGKFSGGLYTDPRITLVDAGPRAFAGQTGAGFDVIHLALTDPHRPVRSGAYSLGENYVYTVEAFAGYIRLLDRDGILVATRWLQTPPSETVRLFAIALEALEVSGVEEPALHLAAYRSFQTGTVLVKRSPWTGSELAHLRQFCRQLRYDLVLYYPGMTAGEANQFTILNEPVYYRAFSALAAAADRQAVYRESEYDITPPTDDRPFFFHFFKWEQTPQVLQEMGKTWQPFGGAGYFVLIVLLLLACCAAAAFILLPLAVTKGSLRPARAGPSLSRTIFFFALLGLGFMFVEISLVQKFILFLDNPTFSLVLILSSILFFSGIGSLTARRWPLKRALLSLAVMVFLYPFLLNLLFRVGLGWPLAARLGAALAGLAPLGYLLGIPFAGGLARLEAEAGGGELIPWAWAINGSASVVASILAALLALTVGFRGVLWLGAAGYALARLIAPGSATRGSAVQN